MTDHPTPSQWLVAYAAALVAMAVLDGLWLGLVAKDFYKAEMGALMADNVRIAPAVAFYLLYPAGLVFLLSAGSGQSYGQVLLRAAVIGAMAYGAYDLTNYSTLKGWSLKLSAVDVAWGTFASAVAGTAVYAVKLWR